jgi:predicted ATPase
MLTALLGDGPELAPLKRLVIERTEGTPFFMEEMVQVLLDEGALVRNGGMKLTKPLAELKIPPTVQAILAARIDRLPPDEKELLQTLAVIGREFPLSLVKRVVDGADGADDDLNRKLGDLQMAEFIYEQPAVGDLEYTFKHALTQEVAYNSLLVERRKLLHERAGQAPSRCSPDSWTIIWASWRVTIVTAITSPRRLNIWGGRANKRCSALLILKRSMASQRR